MWDRNSPWLQLPFPWKPCWSHQVCADPLGDVALEQTFSALLCFTLWGHCVKNHSCQARVLTNPDKPLPCACSFHSIAWSLVLSPNPTRSLFCWDFLLIHYPSFSQLLITTGRFIKRFICFGKSFSPLSVSAMPNTQSTLFSKTWPYFLRNKMLYSSAQILQTTIPIVPLRETHSSGDVSILYSATAGIWRKTIF